jgi:hypothetical protein
MAYPTSSSGESSHFSLPYSLLLSCPPNLMHSALQPLPGPPSLTEPPHPPLPHKRLRPSQPHLHPIPHNHPPSLQPHHRPLRLRSPSLRSHHTLHFHPPHHRLGRTPTPDSLPRDRLPHHGFGGGGGRGGRTSRTPTPLQPPQTRTPVLRSRLPFRPLPHPLHRQCTSQQYIHIQPTPRDTLSPQEGTSPLDLRHAHKNQDRRPRESKRRRTHLGGDDKQPSRRETRVVDGDDTELHCEGV